MDKALVLRMLDLIERQDFENLLLRTLLKRVDGRADKDYLDSLLGETTPDAQTARDVVHSRWLPLRERIESDSNLEEAIQQFVRIIPPAKGVN